MNKCKLCNISTDLFFCPECGKIFKYPNFIQGNIKLEKSISVFVGSLVARAKEQRIQISLSLHDALPISIHILILSKVGIKMLLTVMAMQFIRYSIPAQNH